ncbi:MAG: exosortase K [Polyangiales bacterium]
MSRCATERASVVAISVAIAGGLLLKRYYAQAGVGDLRWVLAPSCWVAERLGGSSFAWDESAGYVNDGARMVVGPACAGVNFLVVCWLALFLSCHATYPRLRDKLGLWAASLGLAYLAAVAANGARIALAARLGHADFHAGIASHATVHRLLGVVVYSVALLAACAAATRWLAASATPLPSRRYVVPLGCYLVIALAVPLARHAFGEGASGLGVHVLQTFAGVAAVAASAWLCERLVDRLSSRRARS